ncbi:hypothetical protein LWC34_32420 [Kibdelosporangium philippinense]|uniref:Uncharacterized protein n=1 Tax=Kibdelosporangium philippinense TaxID=211113 RepID=A0ABS8ZI53_9PSEU|nr:hypothetical protein [Kibdelosporangium philippinense]MCE7007491.1 hypothetical protein [Kibdelosporangium philippinense]
MTNEDRDHKPLSELAAQSRGITQRLEEFPLDEPIVETDMPSERVRLHRQQDEIEKERKRLDDQG